MIFFNEWVYDSQSVSQSRGSTLHVCVPPACTAIRVQPSDTLDNKVNVTESKPHSELVRIPSHTAAYDIRKTGMGWKFNISTPCSVKTVEAVLRVSKSQWALQIYKSHSGFLKFQSARITFPLQQTPHIKSKCHQTHFNSNREATSGSRCKLILTLTILILLVFMESRTKQVSWIRIPVGIFSAAQKTWKWKDDTSHKTTVWIWVRGIWGAPMFKPTMAETCVTHPTKGWTHTCDEDRWFLRWMDGLHGVRASVFTVFFIVCCFALTKK